MSEWILVLILNRSDNITVNTAYFKSQKACKAVQYEINKVPPVKNVFGKTVGNEYSVVKNECIRGG
jgi:hypothetical protein